ncbi:sugar porter family MFS transporter [Paenirhodobacter populi]|uniref:sugar porter family MFS transporter n=1 Tax=Paenirhodobacter populi TaxID=2306993 RepID=UPI000FE404C2|nr:sugar porter family MFS transporter [Sinirhodobacter populi]RWR05258.1 sugar porter family MFS transporter [Sinirhodobacter populi]
MTDQVAEEENKVRLAERIGADLYLLSIVLTVAIAGFLYGYDTGIISGALLQITSEFDLNHRQQELVTSVILVGAVIGALSCGKISSLIGRRYTIMLVAAIFAGGVIAAGLAPSAFWLGAARLVLGFAVGGASQIVPVYIAELAPAEKRGRMVTFFNISIGVGILAAGLVGAFLQNLWDWRMMFAVAAVPAVLLLISMLLLPESPRWLVGQDRVPEARATLDLVRETEKEVHREIRSIEKINDAADARKDNGWRILAQPWMRPALVAGLGVAAFTQLSGIEMLIYYTPTLLTNAGFSHNVALHAALGVAVIYLVMTIVGKLLVDHLGRRRLVLIMLPGAVISLLVMGALFLIGGEVASNAWLIVGCLFAFMVFNAGGIQVIGWLIGSEVYPLSVREKATSLHAAVLWGSNLVLTATALTMVQWLSIGGAMWFYAALNALGFIFVYFLVPETKGKSLEAIEGELRNGTFRP